MNSTCLILLMGTLALGPTAVFAANTYTIDPSHSSITFKVRHFFTPIPGTFSKFSGSIRTHPEDPSKNYAALIIQSASIDTNHDDRDTHLMNEDFFHVDVYPEITFESTEWIPGEEANTYTVTGDFTLLGATKTIQLQATFLGTGEGPNSKTLAGWQVTGTINRSDWGMTYGIPAVGDEVSFEILIESYKEE